MPGMLAEGMAGFCGAPGNPYGGGREPYAPGGGPYGNDIPRTGFTARPDFRLQNELHSQ